MPPQLALRGWRTTSRIACSIAFAATGEPLRAVGHDGVRFTPPDLDRFDYTTDLITDHI